MEKRLNILIIITSIICNITNNIVIIEPVGEIVQAIAIVERILSVMSANTQVFAFHGV